MDNCDLEKLSVSRGKLQPAFTPDVTSYKTTVASNVTKVTLDLITSDRRASCKILLGDGSKTIKLCDGLNAVQVEVVAEDGSSKKRYGVEIIKLSAKTAELSSLAVKGDLPLRPAFQTSVYQYTSTAPFYCHSVTMLAQLPDRHMQVYVNGGEACKPVLLNTGDTTVDITVLSADGSNSQVYVVLVTREPILMAVTFCDEKEQLHYECPVSLTAFYRPVSVRPSDPKHIFSRPYVEMLARRSKVDPLNECPLVVGWKVLEPEVEKQVSAALVKCFFAYRGCEGVMKLSEAGWHALKCPHRPSAGLDTKDIAETNWYKKYFASSGTGSMRLETKKTLEVRNWEKRLQKTVGRDSVDKLCATARDHLKLYWQRLPSPGDMLQYEDGQSPLDSLEQASVLYASAIKLKSKEARLHFLLGQALEEKHYAREMYGLKKKRAWDDDGLSDTKTAERQEDILAMCKLHGLPDAPSLEDQLQALDTEYQHLKDQGQSGKADYVQTLYLWLSKRAGKARSAAEGDEERFLSQALTKYRDAWSLNPDHWEYNLHVGRLLLQDQRSKEALQHLQTGLALRPLQPALRFYTGLAMLRQEEGASGATEKQAALYLMQGLEHLISQRCSQSRVDQWDVLSCRSSLVLSGLMRLGDLQQRSRLSEAMSAEQIYHTVAVLAAQAVSRCLTHGPVTQQLEWVLLEAHYALLQRLTQQAQCQASTQSQARLAKRCRALTALLRCTSIAPCQELLDMQEKVCQIAVVTTPRSSHALCLLGLTQLARYDGNPEAEHSARALADARLSLQASIELQDAPQSGEPPSQLTKQTWWQDGLEAEKPASQPAAGKGPSEAGAGRRGCGCGRGGPGRGGAPSSTSPISSATRGAKAAAKPPVARGRAGAAAAKPYGARPLGKPSCKSLHSPSKSKPDCSPGTTAEESSAAVAVNRRSHVPHLGLARALSRSADTQDQSHQLYQDVISMAPGVHVAYTELAELLLPSDPQAALEVYLRFPQRPVDEQTLDDASIAGEIVHLLLQLELYDHPRLGPNLVAQGKVMGPGCIESYVEILEGKSMTGLLKSVYAGIHDKAVDDEDMLDFFKFKCWI